MAGDGAQRGRVEKLIAENRLTERVTMAGPVDREGLGAVYDRHDVLVQPSQTAADGDSDGGAPIVLLEAQASGLPIVSTWHDDIPNLVKEGKDASLSREKDADGLLEELRLVVNRHRD